MPTDNFTNTSNGDVLAAKLRAYTTADANTWLAEHREHSHAALAHANFMQNYATMAKGQNGNTFTVAAFTTAMLDGIPNLTAAGTAGARGWQIIAVLQNIGLTNLKRTDTNGVEWSMDMDLLSIPCPAGGAVAPAPALHMAAELWY